LINFSAGGEPEKESGDSETDSGNETISSENIEFSGTINEFLSGQSEISLSLQPKSQTETDIDALIAKLTVPPPPKDISLITLEDISPEETSIDTSSTVISNSLDVEGLEVGDIKSLDDEIASLVIPPPPRSSDRGNSPDNVSIAVTMSHSRSSSSGSGPSVTDLVAAISKAPVTLSSSSSGPGSPVSKVNKGFFKECFIRQSSLDSDKSEQSLDKKSVAVNKTYTKEDAWRFSRSDHDLCKKVNDTNLCVKSKSDDSLLQEIESGLGCGLVDQPPPPLRTSSFDTDKKVVIIDRHIPDKNIVIIEKTGPLSYADNWVQQVQSSREAAVESLPYKHGSVFGNSSMTTQASLRDENKCPVIMDSKRPSSLDRVQTRSDGQPAKLTFVQRSNSFQNAGKHRSLISQHIMSTNDKSDIAKFTRDRSKSDTTKDTSETAIPKPLKSILVKRTDSRSSLNSDADKPVPKPRLKRSSSLNSQKRRSSFPLSVLPQSRSDAEQILLRAQSSDQITSQPLKSSFGQMISHRTSSDTVTTPPTSPTRNKLAKKIQGHQRSSSLDMKKESLGLQWTGSLDMNMQCSLSPPAQTEQMESPKGNVPVIRSALRPRSASSSQVRFNKSCSVNMTSQCLGKK
jgi:hypothetical protein